ncbi:ThuA domain-containing protein [Rubinisphaera sp. JC750]|uniref:ThuA domain-containing protein n=1 Tax=Rubinisphaera sp. JC750 TaxID=2898658 RepID=UPI001F3D4E74|nr:ThuA domain-containing protein [Rubinisphaera sp. JC750]
MTTKLSCRFLLATLTAYLYLHSFLGTTSDGQLLAEDPAPAAIATEVDPKQTCSVATSEDCGKERKDASDSINIVLLAADKDHGPAGNGFHDYPSWQKQFASLLRGEQRSQPDNDEPDRETKCEAERLAVSYAWAWPTDQQFATADVIVAYCYIAWTDEKLAQMQQYLKQGGGLVLLHSATWTKPGPMASVAEVTGIGGFSLYRRGDVQMQIAKPDHPVCDGLPRSFHFENDETYWPPTPLADNVTVLATSVEGRGAKGATEEAAQPVLWSYELGRGRVVGCVLGHCLHTFDSPEFQTILLRSVGWVAGEEPQPFAKALMN